MTLTELRQLIQSVDDFKINGISCSTVGLYCDVPSVPPMAKRRVNYYRNGGDTDGFAPDDSYDNVNYPLRAFCFYPDNFDLSAVYAFLASAETLEISRCEGFYFKVRTAEAGQPTQSADGRKITLSIAFQLAPFKYLIDNPEIAVTDTIENAGNRYAKPLYHITGAESTELTVNGESLTITNAGSTDFYIDSAHMLAYTATGENIMMKTEGKFPFLQSGVNTVSLSAGSLAVKVNPRCY